MSAATSVGERDLLERLPTFINPHRRGGVFTQQSHAPPRNLRCFPSACIILSVLSEWPCRQQSTPPFSERGTNGLRSCQMRALRRLRLRTFFASGASVSSSPRAP